MKKYIKYLLEDLEDLKVKSNENLDRFFNKTEASDLDLYHNDDHSGVKVEDLIGMEQIYFPNIDYLTDLETDALVRSLHSVYIAHGLNPIFEKCVTNRIKYGHLRNGLRLQVFPISKQIVDLEMCDYLPQYCPLFDLCSSYNEHNVCCDFKRRA